MSTITVGLSHTEIAIACAEYVLRHHGFTVKRTTLTGGPSFDMMDRATGGFTATATVECDTKAPPTKETT